MAAPLRGVTVLDLTRNLPGALCTQILADFGADVLKVEDPRAGDPVRSYAAPGGSSPTHLAANRGKRSATLNLKHPRGGEVLRTLAGRADVLIENFRPGLLAEMGITFDSLAEENPRLVWCSLSSFGSYGPYRDIPAHGLTMSGYAGFLGGNRDSDGAPVIPTYLTVLTSGGGLMGALTVMAGLAERERTGSGAQVEVNMVEGALWNLADQMAAVSLLGPGAGGMRWESARTRVYRCADGRYVTVNAPDPRSWGAFCAAAGLDPTELADDPAALTERVATLLAGESRDHWVEHFPPEAAVGPVNDIADLLDDPHLAARESFVSVPAPEGAAKVLATPIRFAGEPPSVSVTVPALGEHTDAALRDAGYDDDTIRTLHDDGVV